MSLCLDPCCACNMHIQIVVLKGREVKKLVFVLLTQKLQLHRDCTASEETTPEEATHQTRKEPPQTEVCQEGSHSLYFPIFHISITFDVTHD